MACEQLAFRHDYNRDVARSQQSISPKLTPMQKAPPKSLNKTQGHGSRVWSIDIVTTDGAGEPVGLGGLEESQI